MTNLRNIVLIERVTGMMINKRLICMVEESRKFIAGNVISQWGSLVANIVIMGAVARMLQRLYEGT